MATVLPAGTSNESPFRIGRSGSYEKRTSSKRTVPAEICNGFAPGISLTSGLRDSTPNIFSMSMIACLISRYTMPMKFSG